MSEIYVNLEFVVECNNFTNVEKSYTLHLIEFRPNPVEHSKYKLLRKFNEILEACIHFHFSSYSLAQFFAFYLPGKILQNL